MSDYHPPKILFNGHIETIFPSLFRTVTLNPYQRERIFTPDNDFLDLDWLSQKSKHLIIISHGLEGNTERAYVKGMASLFFKNGYDVLAWNYRGCSNEMNKRLKLYHSGDTDDLHTVIKHCNNHRYYSKISLIGFSLGGNVTLKYLGEQRTKSNLIHSAVAISVPVHLLSSCLQLAKKSNYIYERRFLKSLKNKIIQKAIQYPELNIQKLNQINTLIAFDNEYTAPIHGFKNAFDYYNQCSSLYFLENIKVPTLLINALNDPFLSNQCFPDLSRHQYLRFETPERGGHVGFSLFNENKIYWSEKRSLEFIQQHD